VVPFLKDSWIVHFFRKDKLQFYLNKIKLGQKGSNSPSDTPPNLLFIDEELPFKKKTLFFVPRHAYDYVD